jgi:hypothetical protein
LRRIRLARRYNPGSLYRRQLRATVLDQKTQQFHRLLL